MGMHAKTRRACDFFLKHLAPSLSPGEWAIKRFSDSKTQLNALFYIYSLIFPDYNPPHKLAVMRQFQHIRPMRIVPPHQGVRVTKRVWVDAETYRQHADFFSSVRERGWSIGNAIRAFNTVLALYQQGRTSIPKELRDKLFGPLIPVVQRYLISLSSRSR